MVLTDDDEFRHFVVKMSGGGLQCKFCGQTFSATTSITRFKWHWAGVEGHGVKICAQVTTDFQQVAYQATQQASNKRRKTMPSSSSMHEVIREQTNGDGNLAGEQGGMQMEVQGTGQGVLREERAPSLANAAGNDMENMTGGMTQPIGRSFSPQRLIIDAQYETREDARQATDKAGQVELEGTNWNDIASIAQLMEVDESSGDAFPTENLVGGEFEKNKNAILSWLMNDEASSILAVYGMGGVGKTALLTHIYNVLLETPKSFPHVSWITVSQDFSISKLQNLIAMEFLLDLSREDNWRKRAAKLSKVLSKKKQWVLILDDLWNYFDFNEVGVPIQVMECKVIITTRLFGVCQRMLCQRKIKVEPLSSEEAWAFFMENLGRDITLPPGVEQIAKSITGECAGLPLGIKTMARAMRGVVDIREWRNVLEELQESKVRQDDMEPEVFRKLRFSYTHLKDLALQKCFLFCSLFPEHFEVDRHDLISYLIDEGVINGMKSRQAEIDKGHAMLNKLLHVCLLESGSRYSSDECVRMHDLMRDMALQILQMSSPVIVKARTQLKELPDTEEWTENLVRVSLVENQIEDIPSSHSPRCPYLQTLLLCRNGGLRSIANSFFTQLQRLKILDLSYTNIQKLPDSVSYLVFLTALLFMFCAKLQHVPSLEKLRALKRLDLMGTALENMPQGMECLTSLRYLRMNGCGQKEFPSGILSKLSHLQVLIIEDYWGGKSVPVTVKGKEIGCLRKLETLECYFESLSELAKYLKSGGRTQELNMYKFLVGPWDGYDDNQIMQRRSITRRVGLCGFHINRDVDFELIFPTNIEELVIYKCDDARSLCDVSSSIKHAASLERIQISECNSMESLVSSSPLPLLSYNGIFSGLQEFHCFKCRSMKELFPLVLLPNLENLEVINVSYCGEMEEIIGTRDEESSSISISEFMNLPKLRILELKSLPELKSICSAKLNCNSLEVIEVKYCEKLKRIPICLPLLENGQPSSPPSLKKIEVCPKKWWESIVEWEHPNAKDVLRSFCTFEGHV